MTRNFRTINQISDISIHTLLAESDFKSKDGQYPFLVFQSTLSSQRVTASFHTSLSGKAISIHTLLAESDQKAQVTLGRGIYFNPHSPRREWLSHSAIFAEYDIFQSTLSSQRVTICRISKAGSCLFQSTLSSQRVTPRHRYLEVHTDISIHTLLAESDMNTFSLLAMRRDFNPHSPRREWRQIICSRAFIKIFQSTLSSQRVTQTAVALQLFF